MRPPLITLFLLLSLPLSAAPSPSSQLYRPISPSATVSPAYRLDLSIPSTPGPRVKVTVTIRRRDKRRVEGLLLLLTAKTAKGKSVTREQRTFGLERGQKAAEWAYWVENGDCAPVTVEAHLIMDDETQASALKELIFRCADNGL